jgi:energy-coupling factor transporter ATP-binding protein EcfA2
MNTLRRCFSSTSRPPAWAARTIERVTALIRSAGAERTVLMVEHNLSVVADLSHRITVLTRGRILAEGDYETVSANPRGTGGLHGGWPCLTPTPQGRCFQSTHGAGTAVPTTT